MIAPQVREFHVHVDDDGHYMPESAWLGARSALMVAPQASALDLAVGVEARVRRAEAILSALCDGVAIAVVADLDVRAVRAVVAQLQEAAAIAAAAVARLAAARGT
jgi:hypothetical protein